MSWAGLDDDRWLLFAGLVLSSAIVAGMYIGSTTVVFVAAVATFAAAASFPALGLVVVAFMGPLRAPLAIPAPGFNLILVAAVVLGCLYRLPLSRNRVVVRPPLLFAVAFVAYAFVQQIPELAGGYAGTRAHDIGFLFFQLVTALGAVVAAGFVLRGRSPYPFLAALLISASFAALLGILTADGDPSPRIRNLLSPSDVGGRTTGPFGNPNSYGQFLAYASVLAVGLLGSTRSLGRRAALVIAAGICVYAISLSLSRGAVATLLTGLIVLAFARGRAVGVAALGTALLVVVVGSPLFLEERLAADTGTVTSLGEGRLTDSDQGRFDAVLAAPALLATSPVFGIGFGQYKYVSVLVADEGAGLVAHNWYGTVLAEQGLIGAVLWVAMLVAVAKWLRSRPTRPRSIGFAVFGAVIVGCLFLEPPTSVQTSVLPAIVVTAALVADWGGGIAASQGKRSLSAAPAAGRYGIARGSGAAAPGIGA